MTELDLIIDLHQGADRQGPGSNGDTLKALEMMNLPSADELKVADIGCGSGAQTIALAQYINGHITAVDLLPDFLRQLNEKAQRVGLTESITTLEASMSELPFMSQEFDVIWSEGAIYNMGFEQGIKAWRQYLKEGGYLALTEITWISNSRPQEIEQFWQKHYPEIDTASNKIKVLEDNGYSLSGYFYLKENAWLTNYYEPMIERFEPFLERHNHSELARKVIEDSRQEVVMYQRYKDYYSYGFYIAQKN